MVAGLDACLSTLFATHPALARVVVLLPPSDLGRLVGRGGGNINRIRAESGAEIKVRARAKPPPPDPPSPSPSHPFWPRPAPRNRCTKTPSSSR